MTCVSMFAKLYILPMSLFAYIIIIGRGDVCIRALTTIVGGMSLNDINWPLFR